MSPEDAEMALQDTLRVVGVAVGVLQASVVLAHGSLADRVDRLAKPYVEQQVVDGMTVGVLKDGEQALLGYGALGEGRGRPDADTIYEIGSITKLFTGLLLADAVVEGLVALDQPVGELLPRGVTMPARGDNAIRVLHLATHSSGLPRLPDNLDLSKHKNPYAAYGGRELADFLAGHRLRRGPGEKAEYSNLGMGLLGQVVARQRSLTYAAALRQRIAAPLGLADTTITLSDEQRSRLAKGHASHGEAVGGWDFDTLAGCGAVRSSARDMLRFAAAHLDPPDGPLGEAIELAWRVHQEPLADGDFAMGLAWHVARDGSTRWHNGQTGGYHGMMLVSRPLDAAVVVLANTATGEVDTLAQNLVMMLAGVDVEPRKPDEGPPGTVDVPVEVMRRYAGTYRLAPGAVFTVSENGGRLMVGLTGQPTFQVFPRSETEWFYTVVEATLTFDVNLRGRATAVTLFQNGVRQRAKRIE